MARPSKNHEAAADLGQRLRTLHESRGKPTPKQIELWIWEAFHTRVSSESIRKAHRDEVDPNACDPELVLGLAAYYDVSVTDLGPHAARRTMTVLTMADEDVREELPPRIHVASTPDQQSLFDFAA